MAQKEMTLTISSDPPPNDGLYVVYQQTAPPRLMTAVGGRWLHVLDGFAPFAYFGPVPTVAINATPGVLIDIQ